MKKSDNIISFKKRKIEKKYNKFSKKYKYLIFFLVVPILIGSILTIDKEFVKYNCEIKGIEYNPYINVNKDYIAKETNKSEYKDIKEYYKSKEKFSKYLNERKEAMMKY